MSLKSLTIKNFKILENINFSLDDNLTIISGPNGSGKTSILEGIYYTVNGKSFLTNNNKRLVNFEKNFFFLNLNFENDIVKTSYSKIEDKKNFTINDNKEKVLNLSLKFPFFVFSNNSLSVVRGSKLESYDFFNKILLRLFPSYLQAYREYIKALSIKRDLLRNDAKNDIINSWNRVLEKRRNLLTNKRLWLIENLNKILSSNIKINYFCNNLNKNLCDFLDEEKLKKRVIAGSHKDRFLIYKNNKEVRYFSSSGQQKSVFFEILRSLGILFLKEVNKKPVLLLDDFDSEFDRENMEKVLNSVKDLFQLIVSTTDESKFNKFNFKLIKIYKGHLGEVNDWKL